MPGSAAAHATVGPAQPTWGMTPHRILPFASALFLALAACAGAHDDAPTTTQVTQTCLKTQCDARLASAAQACGDCVEACASASFSCDPSSACENSCADPRPCSASETQSCVSTGFKATLPSDASPELADACKRMVKNATTCGWSGAPTEADCDHFAVVERPERASLYGCEADAKCDADLTPCQPATTTFGDDFCAQADAKCAVGSACPSGFAARLNLEAAWLRQDVLDAVSGCAAQATCSDVRACLAAWTKAVLR